MPPPWKDWPWVSLALALLVLIGCAETKSRPHFSRESGGYVREEKRPSSAPPSLASTGPLAMRGGGNSKLKSEADSYLGVPYSWGGDTRKGMDCSGFVKAVFRDVYSMTLPHSSRKMAEQGRNISKSSLKRGDLVFFGSWMGINHVGIYMGGGEFIHASESSGVMYSKLEEDYYAKRYKGGRRVLK